MRLDLKKQGWINSDAANKIFAALPENSTRFVGGCVRNALLGVEVADYDLATTILPKQVIILAKKAGIAVHATGLEHGTLTLVSDNQVFEITTLRKDISTDGRRATVEFSEDWLEDAKRRDFTVNALYCDEYGKVYDPLGEGLADIKAKRLRFVGNPKARIKEDYLRILRYFRLQSWYFEGEKMDTQALKACRAHKYGLETLSSERVWAETKKLLSAKKPFRTVNTMLVGGILEIIMPEASNAQGLQLLCKLEEKQGLQPDPYLRIMAMSARDEIATTRFCKRMKMSNKEKTRLMKWAGDQTELRHDMEENELKIAIYKAGKQVIMDRAIIRAAGAGGCAIRNKWLDIYKLARDWKKPEFPVTGNDLINAGFASGKDLGNSLKALEALWVRSGFKAEKQALLTAISLIKRD